MDDVHRSGSVLEYNRSSRRDAPQNTLMHVRSKSADYLMDRKYARFNKKKLQKLNENRILSL